MMEEALRSGRIDMGTFPVVFARKALDAGGVRVLFSISDVIDRTTHMVAVFDRSFAQQNPGVMKAFQEDFRLTARYFHEHSDESIQLPAQVMNLDPKFLDTYELTAKDYYDAPDGMPDLQVIQENWDFMQRYGFIKQKMNVDDYVIEELLK